MRLTGAALGAVVVGLLWAAAGHATGQARDGRCCPPPIVERFLGSGDPDAVSAVAVREMQVSTLGGRLRASVTARTTIDANGRFTFEVVRAEGSDLLRSRVLVAALEAERQSREPGASALSALSPSNYAFAVVGSAGAGRVEIDLTPRRRSRMLVLGRMLVDEGTGELVQVDGRLSETPSWWTTRVEIVRRYALIGGVRMPVEMSSHATVRVAGSATFSMVYRYESINGRRVGAEP